MLKTLVLIFLIFTVTSCTKKTSNDIVIGFAPSENADIVATNGKALTELIHSSTGLKLKPFVSTDYSALIEALRSGNVHFAFLPPFSFVQAEKIAHAKVLLKSVRHGRAVLYSAIISAKDITSVQDLKGKSMAWTDPVSASGHILPKSALMDLGIQPDEFFGKQVFAGGHDAVLLAVLNKTVDAGATYANAPDGSDGAWTQLLKKPEEKNKIKVVYVTPPVPSDTLATTEKFYNENKDLVDQFVKTMQNLHKTDAGKKLLYELYHVEAMVPATSEEYEPLRKAAKRLNITQ